MRTRIARKAQKVLSVKPNSKVLEFYVSKEHNIPVKKKTIYDLFKNI